MRVINNPRRELWPKILRRPSTNQKKIENAVADILAAVREKGDETLFELTERFDGVALESLLVSEGELEDAASQIQKNLKKAIARAKSNIETFHRSQIEKTTSVETAPGVTCWRKSVPIQKVGLYIRGGAAKLFSTVLMLGVPAKLAGCLEIVLCTPPDRNGDIHPTILYTAHLVGIQKIFKIGGAQAIAAMACGTETIPAVDKVFGPGNSYVTVAKMLVQREGVAMDMPAGPTEVAIYGDHSSHPAFVAADMISQAEHGVESQALLVTTDGALAVHVQNEIERQLANFPRAEIAWRALQNKPVIFFENRRDALDFLNEFAPQNLIIASDEAEKISASVVNAGSVFLGHFSPQAAGDYAAGTNHALPTHGFAKAWSGVSLDSFVKKITFQELTLQGLHEIGSSVERMAQAERLAGHKRAISIRLAEKAS